MKSVLSHTLIVSFVIFYALAWSISSLCAQTKAQLPDFTQAYNVIMSNQATYKLYQDSVRADLEQEEWLAFMYRRSNKINSIYQENNTMLDGITGYFEHSDTIIPDAAYDSLFSFMYRMYETQDYDIFLSEQFVNMLLPHYEALSDTTHLLALNHIAGNCNAQMARSFEPEAADRALSFYRRNLEYSSHYEMLSPTFSRYVPIDYINLCYMMSDLGALSASEALSTTDEFESFLSRYDASFTEEERTLYHSYLERIRSTAIRVFSGKENVNKNAADSLAFIRMYELSPFKQGLNEFNSLEDSVNYFHSKAIMREMSYEDAFSRCDELLVHHFGIIERNDTITEDDILAIGNNMITTISLLDKASLPDDQKMQRVLYFAYHLDDLIQRARIADNAYFFDFILYELACNSTIVSLLPSGYKERFMSQLAVKSQLGVSVHVNMVENLCLVFLDALLNSCPEQFLDVMGLKTVQEIQAKRGILMRYMSMAALFHDVGKNQLSEISNNDFRKLTQHEVAILRRHPEYSNKYLDLDPIFNQYRDIALGHHKWYNGEGGYPESFDNVHSVWRPLIDLLTICDCIDAATDNIGRNYKRAKTLSQVIDEMKEGAGTRYNPVMVEVLASDPVLIEQINAILSANRIQLHSNMRTRYILNNR